ncbi:MAG: cobalamin-binding protein [Candidatus Fluviicola riflensis]|nr:MAG: cobalamin-binding protein [Candidatus Fluviicola riflensis]OGS79339.1 MAG: cobalamin-binding protein [Candidatus Fluviicola riflensis]OGS86771.1 MAG: cobalamin-binding protein [Fluviicola sp. RIFCSPHIGHO2_01_FULL_43_53]OGS88756.1 MAG: cobalamin-binding protein [Fluviicola sp. RIFCSPHIGHO2_12_FULL_43_24]
MDSITTTDQMGRTVSIPFPVRRIVSLVPSQTELLVDLGVEDLLVGVTKFCVHPAGMKERVGQIGGTKTVKIDKVIALKPDLVIGNKEENLQSDIEELEQHLPVWMSDIHDLETALNMIRHVGSLVEKGKKALEVIDSIQQKFNQLDQVEKSNKLTRVLYLIWRKPYMAAGKGTFIDDCLKRCGWINCISETRYPEIDTTSLNPDLILLSSEPYPFKENHIEELQVLFPKAKIELVDGEYFSWYGTRLLGAPDYFIDLLDRT